MNNKQINKCNITKTTEVPFVPEKMLNSEILIGFSRGKIDSFTP